MILFIYQTKKQHRETKYILRLSKSVQRAEKRVRPGAVETGDAGV